MPLARLDMPAPLTQVFVYGELGELVGIADFGIEQHKTLVEFDGRSKYGLDGLTGEAVGERLWREKLREDELRRLGWEIVRLIWADLYRPERIARLLRDAFARAAARPGPVRGSFSLVPH